MRALSLVAPSEQMIRTRSSCRSVARYNCTRIHGTINFKAKTTASNTIPMTSQRKLSYCGEKACSNCKNLFKVSKWDLNAGGHTAQSPHILPQQ